MKMKNEKTITLRKLKKRCEPDELFNRVLRYCDAQGLDTQDLDTEIKVGRLLAMVVDEARAARAVWEAAEEEAREAWAWARAARARAARAARAAAAEADTYEKIEKLLRNYIAREYRDAENSSRGDGK